MTRDDCINLANQCGMNVGRSNLAGSIDALETFAGLVAEAEREACASICDHEHGTTGDAADKIRMRSNVEFRRGEALACNAGLGAERPGKD